MYKLTLIMLSSIAYIGQAQIPFANVGQMPLLQNPAHAGGKNQKRAMLAWNNTQEENYKYRALHLAYDDFRATQKVGIGFYYLGYAQTDALKDVDTETHKRFFKVASLQKEFSQANTHHRIGACVALKYNLGSPNELGLYNYTLSPSLELGYEYSNSTLHGGFQQSYARAEFPDTIIIVKDSLYFAESRARSNLAFVGLGFKVTAPHWMLMYAFNFSQEHSSESYDLFQGSLIDSGQSKVHYGISNNYSKGSHRLSGTYAIVSKPNTKTNLIFTAGLELSQYLGLKTARTHKRLFMSEVLKQRLAIPLLSGVYASATYRYRKLLSGIAYAKWNFYDTYGCSIGLQDSQYRLLCTLYPNSDFKSLRTTELSLHLFF